MNVGEIIRKTTDLVSLPEVYYRAQEVLDDPTHDDTTLVRVIETDTALTARLLKVANSSLYGPPRRVERIAYAVALIGSKALNDLILATTIARAFQGISPDQVDTSSFWHHSIYCGLVARNLGRRCVLLHDERMLVAGMLHDVGQLALYQYAPAEASAALAAAEANDSGLIAAELEILGFTHADVGAELLKQWKLPISLQEVAAYHHFPKQAKYFPLDCGIVHIANSIANRMEPSHNVLALEERIHPEAWDMTGLDPAAAEDALTEANDQFVETLELLLPGRPLL